MIYKDFKGMKLSALGMGTMRLPTVDGTEKNIDVELSEKMVAYAMEHGVNYYDTAWAYHDGNSETVMGSILKKYPRESFYLASKFPGYALSNIPKVEKIFEKQLVKCQVDYFDFYLFHNVCELNIEPYLDPQYGILEYLLKQKENGRIKHLGLSVHGSIEVLEKFLNAYGKYMEFCQIQLNYVDYEFQDAKAKIELLKKWNIPIWVMEPVRGGKLAKMDEKYASQLRAMRPDETIPGWAFRFIQSIPEVTVTLSGMSDYQQMADNIKTFETDEPLTPAEFEKLIVIADEMVKKIALPCTACHYCTSHCPQQLDIPALLELYNEHSFTGGGFLAPMAMRALDESKHPSACIGCRSCEEVCPQQIKISEAMSDFAEKLKNSHF